MIRVRAAADRGHFDHGWLRTWHTFSFADYYDPAHVHFRALRVLNEDIVAPGKGFGMHPHRDMEILTWILSGSLRHQDSMGHEAVIRPGEAQVMSAGTGILHSEHNASERDPVHLLQVWLLPGRKDLPTRYGQAAVDPAALAGALAPLAAPPGQDAAVLIHQDARVFGTRLQPGQETGLEIAAGRHVWVQVARGGLVCNGTALRQGDGAALSQERALRLRGGAPDSEALVFDLA
jgi:redox-sensitive bicupin YhaK (pirin superfamily)